MSNETAAWAPQQPPQIFQLSETDRLLVWAIRSWAAYHDAPQLVRTVLKQVFNDHGFPELEPPFARFMSAVFGGLKRLPDIRCIRCTRLGCDELALLALLSTKRTLQGEQQPDMPMSSLNLWLNKAALASCAQSGAEVAMHLHGSPQRGPANFQADLSVCRSALH